MAAVWNRAGHYILSWGFFYLLSFFLSFFFPRLISAVGDGRMSTILLHALMRIQNVGVNCAARGSLKKRMQKNAKNSPSAHRRTNLSGYIFATKACIDNRKNLLKSNIFSTSLHNMVNFGPLTAEIVGEFGAPQQISTAVSQLRHISTIVKTR